VDEYERRGGKAMFVELHLLQHFAPSNLNRDDTGAPKDCYFGGVRRARISSQCIKRAIRTYVQQANLLDVRERAVRTKRLIGEITTRLAQNGKDESEADRVARVLLQSVGIQPMSDQSEKTEYLLFIGEDQIAKLVDIAERYWDTLGQIDPASGEDEQKSSRPRKKKEAKAALPETISSEVKTVLNAPSAAVDLALFGRMIADVPLGRVDAASQVAHAISTHQVSVEFDYFTAVDDLLPQEKTGADMIGTVEFNSACYYRYANVDIEQLVKNLGGDIDLARKGLAAFLTAAVHAVPTGKQNSFAAHNPPAFVATVVREHGLWSLANAFVQPVRANEQRDLVQESIRALDRYWAKLTGLYGSDGLRALYVATHEPEHVQAMRRLNEEHEDTMVPTVRDLIERTIASALNNKLGGS
jgi:CRISPR system Cascade subunit CasC